MRKLLGQQSSSTIESQDNSSAFSDSPQPQLRPTASQHTVYSARSPIACVARSPDGQRAVIAGLKVFKTLRVDGSTITDDLDLRSVISKHASTHDASAATADQFDIRAIKWAHSELDTTIITACGNGRITLYDLNRVGEGLEVARIQEHVRQVHQLAINPFKCNWLLSASQDGTVKLYDIRTPLQGRNGPTFRASQTFKCNADAVRDVKWSPTDGFEFACSTDSGAILKWDIRKPPNPNLKITAHQGSCFSISWHPDGECLVSGGIDQQCKVWELSKKAESRQKPRYSFATPAPISSVSWRPPCWSATAQGNRAAQVTIAYSDIKTSKTQSSMVHIWDLARPTMPFKEIEQWSRAPSGLLWNTRDLLWSVDEDGHFTQTDVAFIPKYIDRQSLSNLAFSPNGDVIMLLEQRQTPRRPRPSISSPEVSPSYQHNSNGPLLSVSRSDSEEDVVGSFLGPRRRKRHRRRHSSRSTQGLSTTPPSVTNMAEQSIMSLDEAVKVTGTYKTQQVMAIGHAPSTARRDLYQYFSNHYLERMAEDKPNTGTQPIDERLTSTVEYFAQMAENVGHFRLAQTWRVLGFTLNLLLTRRAEHHRQSRLTLQQGVLKKPPTKEGINSPRSQKGEETPRKFTRVNTPSGSPLLAATRKHPDEIESTSNVATPLVRPMRETIAREAREAMHTPLLADDILELPEAAHSTSPTPIPVPGSSSLTDHTTPCVEGYDYFDTASFAPVADYVAPQRKQPLRLDYVGHVEPINRIQPQRHDSGESFQMFSTSADSSKFMSSGDSEAHSFRNEDSLALRERVSSWENSFHSHEKHRASIDSEAPGQSEALDEQMPSFDQKNGINIGNPQTQEPPPILRIQEASAPSAIDTKSVKRPAQEEEDFSPSSTEKVSDDPNIIHSDYLPWQNDPPFTINAIDPTILIQRSIDFESQTGALNASSMVLLLRPLLPSHAIDDIQATSILRQYHHRLTSMKLFTEATILRNLCVPLYPSVFSMAQENITIGYFCTDCHKPLENDPLIQGSVWRCPRCQQVMNGCAVCHQRDADEVLPYPAEETVDSILWYYCPGCGHGGHTACMAAWHSGPEFSEGANHSGGACPLEGCLHPCLPGTWREQCTVEKKMLKAKELDTLVKENARHSSGAGRGGGVRRDRREVAQSRAVEGVRVALGLGGLERKKSVKVVAPGEERGDSK